jgi:hypothetical protein
MPDIEDLFDLVSIISEQPAKYLPLADEISCPFCKYMLHDEIDRPEEGIREMKCQRCNGVFYFDYRVDLM